eukprot:7023132-Ditylum_brightwellii.AAC.1
MLPANKLLDISKTSKYGVLPNPTGIEPHSAGVRKKSPDKKSPSLSTPASSEQIVSSLSLLQQTSPP